MNRNTTYQFAKTFIILSVAMLSVMSSSQGQRTGNEPLTYELAIAYPSLSITQEALSSLSTLSELNKYYKSDWVKEFKRVEVIAMKSGVRISAIGKHEELTSDQLDVMRGADEGTEIIVNITYVPDNNLTHNDPKEFNYSLTVEPDVDARFVGGEKSLDRYIQESIIARVPSSSFTEYAMSAVKFTIDEEGHVFNAHMFESSKDESIDDVLLSAICNMPNWTPASYKSGVAVKQEFALIVGSLDNCMIPLLNVRRADFASNR